MIAFNSLSENIDTVVSVIKELPFFIEWRPKHSAKTTKTLILLFHWMVLGLEIFWKTV